MIRQKGRSLSTREVNPSDVDKLPINVISDDLVHHMSSRLEMEYPRNIETERGDRSECPWTLKDLKPFKPTLSPSQRAREGNGLRRAVSQVWVPVLPLH
jgi:hypothetical protein